MPLSVIAALVKPDAAVVPSYGFVCVTLLMVSGVKLVCVNVAVIVIAPAMASAALIVYVFVAVRTPGPGFNTEAIAGLMPVKLRMLFAAVSSIE